MIKNYFVLRQANKSIGLRSNETSYILGFENKVQARHVQYNMHPEQELQLVRSGNIINVGEEVQLGLRQLGVDRHFNSIIIEDVKVVVAKSDQSLPSALKDGGFHMETLPGEEFICMPFTKHIGIIIPLEIDYEDNKQIVLSADLIEPFIEMGDYVKSLNNLLN